MSSATTTLCKRSRVVDLTQEPRKRCHNALPECYHLLGLERMLDGSGVITFAFGRNVRHDGHSLAARFYRWILEYVFGSTTAEFARYGTLPSSMVMFFQQTQTNHKNGQWRPDSKYISATLLHKVFKDGYITESELADAAGKRIGTDVRYCRPREVFRRLFEQVPTSARFHTHKYKHCIKCQTRTSVMSPIGNDRRVPLCANCGNVTSGYCGYLRNNGMCGQSLTSSILLASAVRHSLREGGSRYHDKAATIQHFKDQLHELKTVGWASRSKRISLALALAIHEDLQTPTLSSNRQLIMRAQQRLEQPEYLRRGMLTATSRPWQN